MQRLFGALVLGLMAIAVLASPVSAGRLWCAKDPIVRLGGVEYQVIVKIPEENVPQVDGELLFEIYSPKGMKQQLIFMDEGFNGYGEKIVFKQHDAKKKHTFYLDVPHNNDKFPVIVEVYRNGALIRTVQGTSDVVWIDIAI